MTNDAAATYIANVQRAARIVEASAHRAGDSALGYHRKNLYAVNLVAQAYDVGGYQAVVELERSLVRTDADDVLLAEIRRLARAVAVRQPPTVGGPW